MGPATLKARADVASNRENIPGRGWGVGMVPEHTLGKAPWKASHTEHWPTASSEEGQTLLRGTARAHPGQTSHVVQRTCV